MRAENIALGRSGSSVFPLSIYSIYIYIYLCLTSLRSVLFLASLATLALFFLHLLILIYFAYIFRNQRRCSYSEIYWLYFHRNHRETVKFSILENIALYFQNLIERLFLCARSLTLARKNFRSFPGQVPGPFFNISISI